ncbi:MAPEG family protein [Kaarinaea lacus]
MLKEIMLTTDLKMLIATATLALLSIMPYFIAYIKYWGIAGIVGNRENLPALPQWAQRAQAAHANLTENLVHFSVLVIVAHVTAASNEITAMGATLFFWARIAYLVIYMAGIPWLRTIAFMAGWVGEVMILTQLF